MSSSKFLIFHMLFTLVILAVPLEATPKLPIVHFINAVGKDSDPIDLHINGGGVSSVVQITSGQDYGMRVKLDDVHNVMCVFGSKFASFHAYEPARDKGYAAVFWRANGEWFSMSHDKVHWKKVARWQYE